MSPQHKNKKFKLAVILLSGFLSSVSAALVVYINSSVLETIISRAYIGIFFAIAYFITFVVLQEYGQLIERYTNHMVLIMAFVAQIISTLVVALDIHPLLSLLAIMFLLVTVNITIVNFDVMLEMITTNQETGRIRGLFWLVVSVAFVISPALSGYLYARYGTTWPYLLSAGLLIPCLILIYGAYRKQTGIHFQAHKEMALIVSRVWSNIDLRGIFVIAFILYFFYSWMVIYTPLHLLQIGYTWQEIGQIFTVMLLPFVILQYPVGYLADKKWGEVEMLSLGLGIMGLSVIALLFVSDFWAIMLVLFMSRVGASMVEVLRDTYFYKQVDEDDLDLIGAFRNMASVANIIAPILASVLLFWQIPLTALFAILGVGLLISVFLPWTLKDTK